MKLTNPTYEVKKWEIIPLQTCTDGVLSLKFYYGDSIYTYEEFTPRVQWRRLFFKAICSWCLTLRCGGAYIPSDAKSVVPCCENCRAPLIRVNRLFEHHEHWFIEIPTETEMKQNP